MFRGTLKLNTLKATLQMVNHLVEVAVSMSDSEVQDMSWFDFLDTVHRAGAYPVSEGAPPVRQRTC